MNCFLEPSVWARINREDAFTEKNARGSVAPFPPPELMQNVSGLTSEKDFASHGADFWLALSAQAKHPLSTYTNVLDLGCGCGRLGRMFKGHTGNVYGCDIDSRHVEWVNKNLPYINAVTTQPDQPLPYSDNMFNLIISISIFTHLNETSQDILLSELRRISKNNNCELMLTVHSERALTRAEQEENVFSMLSIERESLKKSRKLLAKNKHCFNVQNGHLTNGDFEYGITFMSHDYVKSHWGKWFNVDDIIVGGIHDFQDIVVLSPK